MKKTKKFMSTILAVILLFTSVPFAFASDFSSVYEDIDYIKANARYWYIVKCERLEDDLKIYETDAEKYEEEIAVIISEVADLRSILDECAKGNHDLSYLMSDSYPLPCTAAVSCDYCTYRINNAKLQTKNANHVDKDKNDICDECDLELHYQDCRHICHNNSFIVSKILMPILMWLWDEFQIEEFCECGMYHGYYKSFL